jgi:general secretion pathway protein L
MLAELFGWWRQHMAELLPERLLRRGPDLPDATILQPETSEGGAPSLTVLRRRGGEERRLATYALDSAGAAAARAAVGAAESAMLRLGPGALLERQVVLPLAAERDLDRLITYDLNRLTPFTADEVFWTAAIERRDRAQGKLTVRLSLVLRARVEGVLAPLQEAGLAPAALEVVAADGAPRRIALGAGDARRAALRRRLRQGGVALAGGLAVAIVALPFVLQSLAFSRLDARIEAVRPRMERAEALRRRILERAHGADAMAVERARVGDVLQALAIVTERLPDSTFLTGFTYRQRHLTLEGSAKGAAQLISLLAADRQLRNAAFSAPVTRNAEGADLFSIRADFGS